MNNNIVILVVDDSPTMRMTLEMTLGKTYTVLSAVDGVEGLERYRESRPDIILLDIDLPGMNGFEILKSIRETERDQETFILVLTAQDAKELQPRALNMGANDFLFKPFDRTELMARVGVAARQVLLTRQLTESMRSISREINMLASLQSRLLPQSTPRIPGVRVETLYHPSGQASGDYYDFFLVGDNILRLVMADVSGHGARAAFLMAIVRTLFRLSRHGPMTLEETLTLINTHLTEIIGDQSDFTTVFAADIDFSRKTMKYLNAGHCPGMLMDETGRISRLDPRHPLLGFFKVEFAAQSVPFPTGAGLFLYTDGFYDWATESGAILDMDQFWNVASGLMSRRGPLLADLMDSLKAKVKDEPGFRDDLTAMWVNSGADR